MYDIDEFYQRLNPSLMTPKCFYSQVWPTTISLTHLISVFKRFYLHNLAAFQYLFQEEITKKVTRLERFEEILPQRESPAVFTASALTLTVDLILGQLSVFGGSNLDPLHMCCRSDAN